MTPVSVAPVASDATSEFEADVCCLIDEPMVEIDTGDSDYDYAVYQEAWRRTHAPEVVVPRYAQAVARPAGAARRPARRREGRVRRVVSALRRRSRTPGRPARPADDPDLADLRVAA